MTDHSKFVVVAPATARPGKEKDVERALGNAAEPTRAQPGSILFSSAMSGTLGTPVEISCYELVDER
jgi:quinol monooxygenase YgiN